VTVTDEQAQTAAWYNANGKAWTTPRSDPYWDREIDALLELMPPDGHVLELGPGSGRDAALLMGRGLRYTGIDNSPGMLRVARANVPGGRFVQCAMAEAGSLGECFDGWWAIASLGIHVPPEHLPDTLLSLASVLKQGAPGVVTTKPGPTSWRICDDEAQHGLSNGRWVMDWDRDEFEGHLEAAGLRVIRRWPRPPGDFRGGQKGWECYLTIRE
jgi:SAM-dependent methyltransferase